MAILTANALLDKLSAEHEELAPKIVRLTELAEGQDARLAAEVDAEADFLQGPLNAHIAAEDDLLFPAYANATGEHEVTDLFTQEHRQIQALRDELLAIRRGEGRRQLAEVVLEMCDLLTHHQAREEGMLFPSARQLNLQLPA